MIDVEVANTLCPSLASTMAETESTAPAPTSTFDPQQHQIDCRRRRRS